MKAVRWRLESLSHSPGHPCRVINPICPILASVREDTRVADILYFRALLLIRSAQADNQKMYIKRYNDQILSIIGDIYSQNRVGSRGLSVPDEKVCSLSTKPAWHMPKARLSAAFQQSCPIRHTCSAMIPRCSINWQYKNSNHLTPNLAILNQEKFVCFKSWPKNPTPFQNSIMVRFGRWQSPSGKTAFLILSQSQPWAHALWNKLQKLEDALVIFFKIISTVSLLEHKLSVVIIAN